VGAGAITTIESLAGRYSGRWRLMGILSEAEYGLHYIEDPTGRLLVDLSHAVRLSANSAVGALLRVLTTTRHDTTRHDTTRHDTTRHDTTRHAIHTHRKRSDPDCSQKAGWCWWRAR
jgi:hypothetical protein